MKVVAIVLVLTLCVASTLAQHDQIQRYMLMNMLQGGRGGATPGTPGGAAGGNPLAALFGGAGGMGRGLGLMMAGGGLSDRARDMMICNMMGGNAQSKQLCMAMAMA